MICLNCVRGYVTRKPNCQHCGDCEHICKDKCSKKVRIKKIANVEREQGMKYYAKQEDRNIAGISLYLAPTALCDNCHKEFVKVVPLQRFCKKECGNKARAKNLKALRTSQPCEPHQS